MKICAEIPNFYREVIAPVEFSFSPQGGIKKISPLTRFDFNTGATLALLFVVQKIALSIFFLISVIVTVGLKKNFRVSLSKNFKEIFIYSGAVPLGFIGVLFPQTINQKILLIPIGGLITPYS